MPAITVSRDQVDEIAGLYLDDSEEVFDIVEDDGDEDEIWTSEGDVIEHTDVLEDDWVGILIEEETEDKTKDKSEEIGSGIELEEPAQHIKTMRIVHMKKSFLLKQRRKQQLR